MNPINTSNSASKSMIAQNVTLLNEYQALIDRIFASIAANAEGKPTDRPPVEIMKDIVELDKKMQQGLDQIEEHQRVHKKILQIIKEIEAENNAFMEFVNELKNGKEQLEICLDEANETIQAINFSSESSVTADEILKYANRISSYTSAPPNYISGTFAEPPYPDESRMRRSFLFRQDVDIMFDEGDKNDDEDEEEDDGDDMHYIKPNPYSSLEAMQQTEPFNLDLNPDLE
ncbi:vitamin-D-receptor interacting mediator subunit 4-domain-containing protein [Gigaspora rosea]|uniref:Mediator of RNA polymerase II transcription subunit 4 n=1 Tax=Gigaspora rosea TaxID=44941 RepID=A0A397UHH4_9GLOM|nr:vitamin-D-receptor interacting mediator subunit 4-domain-containing protein [Gigaspora rosea]